VFPQETPTGTIPHLHLNPTPRPIPASTPLHPWQVFQHPATTPNPTSDWRTVRVRYGSVNNAWPKKDGADTFDPDFGNGGDDTDIVIPASTTGFKIYLKLTLVTADGASQGNVTKSAIVANASGWNGYPQQPEGDWLSGAPPTEMFLLIGECDTTAEGTGPGDQKLTIRQNLISNIWTDMYGFELVTSVTGVRMAKRMSARNY
jgi:hypothetical protein